MLAGGKQENPTSEFIPRLRDTNPETSSTKVCKYKPTRYQGMIFLIPFFFLLVDSVLVSAFAPLAG
jgi:hypothetical protein